MKGNTKRNQRELFGQKKTFQMKAQNAECNEEYQIGVNMWVNSE